VALSVVRRWVRCAKAWTGEVVGWADVGPDFAVGMLTRVSPPVVVDEVVAGCGDGLFRARDVSVLRAGYEEVARLLTQGLERFRWWEKP